MVLYAACEVNICLRVLTPVKRSVDGLEMRSGGDRGASHVSFSLYVARASGDAHVLTRPALTQRLDEILTKEDAEPLTGG